MLSKKLSDQYSFVVGVALNCGKKMAAPRVPVKDDHTSLFQF